MMSSISDSDLKLADVDILSVLSSFDEGVIIADRTGRILFYNESQSRIDDLEPTYAIGKRVTDVYHLEEKDSRILRCIRTGKPILNQLFFYRTCRGKVANTIHSVFPLPRGGEIIGAICFVKDYNILEKTITSASDMTPYPKPTLGNGTRYQFSDIVGTDDAFIRAVTIARLAADSPSPIMLYGETGTGKELFAQSIHNYSSRHTKRFMGINCAAIPENLLEGLLFGTTKGAFTGAINRSGVFEQTQGSTLFLDELNAMPVSLQAKLLRALQERKIRRVGSAEDIEIDLKIISSVNADPHQAIKAGTLRIDLFYRLGVVFIRIPPLREHAGAIEPLVRHFIYKNNLKLGKQIRGVSDKVMDFFRRYHWPGNVRELEHIIEGTMNMMGMEDRIEVHHLPFHFIHPDFRELAEASPTTTPELATAPAKAWVPQPQSEEKLPEIQQNREEQMINGALGLHRGNISRAARRLGVSRQLLHYKMKKYGLKREDFR